MVENELLGIRWRRRTLFRCFFDMRYCTCTNIDRMTSIFGLYILVFNNNKSLAWNDSCCYCTSCFAHVIVQRVHRPSMSYCNNGQPDANIELIVCCVKCAWSLQVAYRRNEHCTGSINNVHTSTGRFRYVVNYCGCGNLVFSYQATGKRQWEWDH